MILTFRDPDFSWSWPFIILTFHYPDEFFVGEIKDAIDESAFIVAQGLVSRRWLKTEVTIQQIDLKWPLHLGGLIRITIQEGDLKQPFKK